MIPYNILKEHETKEVRLLIKNRRAPLVCYLVNVTRTIVKVKSVQYGVAYFDLAVIEGLEFPKEKKCEELEK